MECRGIFVILRGDFVKVSFLENKSVEIAFLNRKFE